MPQTNVPGELPLGLVEMDMSGTILYYNRESNDASVGNAPDIVGRNFFTDVVPVSCSPEFRELVKRFCDSHAPSSSFNCTVPLGDRLIPVRVLLARLHERSEGSTRESVIVHIKPG